MEDVSRELRSYQGEIQFDPERLATIEERLEEITRLKRKYGATIAEILLYADKCSQELAGISNREERSPTNWRKAWLNSDPSGELAEC